MLGTDPASLGGEVRLAPPITLPLDWEAPHGWS
jgi:hypothetical protein